MSVGLWEIHSKIFACNATGKLLGCWSKSLKIMHLVRLPEIIIWNRWIEVEHDKCALVYTTMLACSVKCAYGTILLKKGLQITIFNIVVNVSYKESPRRVFPIRMLPTNRTIWSTLLRSWNPTAEKIKILTFLYMLDWVMQSNSSTRLDNNSSSSGRRFPENKKLILLQLSCCSINKVISYSIMEK